MGKIFLLWCILFPIPIWTRFHDAWMGTIFHFYGRMREERSQSNAASNDAKFYCYRMFMLNVLKCVEHKFNVIVEAHIGHSPLPHIGRGMEYDCNTVTGYRSFHNHPYARSVWLTHHCRATHTYTHASATIYYSIFQFLVLHTYLQCSRDNFFYFSCLSLRKFADESLYVHNEYEMTEIINIMWKSKEKILKVRKIHRENGFCSFDDV